MMRSAIGFLVDMDGVIYRGSELIPGAKDFIERLLEEHIPFLFLTNNSQRTRRDVAIKLNRMGVEVSDRHVFTCAWRRPGSSPAEAARHGLRHRRRWVTASAS